MPWKKANSLPETHDNIVWRITMRCYGCGQDHTIIFSGVSLTTPRSCPHCKCEHTTAVICEKVPKLRLVHVQET
jgi:hypothetical protein